MLNTKLPARTKFGKLEKFTWNAGCEHRAKLFRHNQITLWHKLCILVVLRVG
jgi:hypothetical protein